MTKYFIIGTDKEIHFGDYITVDEDAVMKIECKFTPDSVDTLLDYGIIEAKDDEVKERTIKLEDNDINDLKNSDVISAMLLSNEKLEKRLDSIQKDIKFLTAMLKVKKNQ